MARAEDGIDEFVRHLARLPASSRPNLEVEALVDRIHSVSRRFRRDLERALAEHGLGVSDLQLLTRLRLAPSGRSAPGALARALELTPGAITNRLDRLERQAYVRRLPVPADRRAVVVELTDAGRAVWQRLVAEQGRREEQLAGVLTPVEQRRLNVLLRKLMLVFEPGGLDR